MSSLRNRVALVTGSTSGIGRGIAVALAEQGARVMLHGLGDAAEIERFRAGLEQRTGTPVRYHAADAARPGEISRMIAATEEAFGALDILVNNAGIQHVSPIE